MGLLKSQVAFGLPPSLFFRFDAVVPADCLFSDCQPQEDIHAVLAGLA